jgi:hypothetical protein
VRFVEPHAEPMSATSTITMGSLRLCLAIT